MAGYPFPPLEASLGGAAETCKRPKFIEFYKNDLRPGRYSHRFAVKAGKKTSYRNTGWPKERHLLSR